MPYHRVALFAVALYMLAGFAYCSRCGISQPEQNCLTLWTAFQDSLLNQRSNLLRLDLMFNQPSQLTPTVVKVIYNYSIAGLNNCNPTCVDSNCSVVLGWTTKSLYIYFHVSMINKLQFQLPFLIIKYFEGSELREEPDVDDFLWVGDNQTSLPELYLTLDVTFPLENSTLNGCPSNEDITNALGELNHWLRAFAKVALQDTAAMQNVKPDYKGYTLPQSGVEPYNYNESNIDPNEEIGQQLFLCMYIVNAVIAYVFGIFLYQQLHKVYDGEVKKEKDDPFRLQFFTVILLASVYFVALYLADIYYYMYIYNWNNRNGFIDLLNRNGFIDLLNRNGFIPVMGWVLSIPVNYCNLDTLTCRSTTKAPCLQRLSFMKIFSNIIREVSVGLLTLAIVLLILGVFPTLLLFFAHPLNTSALLVIHIALFYIETKTGMLVIEQLNKSKCTQNLLYTCKRCRSERNQGSSTKLARKSLLSKAHNKREYKSNTNGVVLAIWVVLMLIGSVIVYPIVMWFYHILLLRSLINNLAFDIFIKHIPNVVIALSGFMYLIQNGPFYSDNGKDN